MCGIIAIARRRSEREPEPVEPLLERLEQAGGHLSSADGSLRDRLEAAAAQLEAVDEALRGVPGVRTLLGSADGAASIDRLIATLSASAERIEAELDDSHAAAVAGVTAEDRDELEATNAALIRCKDALWAIGRDRLRAADRVAGLGGDELPPAGVAVLFSVHQSLSALDRLEVRGRDSAGVEIQLTGHGLDADDPTVRRLLEQRSHPGFTSGAVRLRGETLVIVHKAAAEIGELGDNTAVLREAMRNDELLQLALASPEVEGLVLGHTRWASIGIISEPNAHPQCSDELDTPRRALRLRRAQRRRRQLRGPDRRRGPAHLHRDHHRRQGHPDADVAPPVRGPGAERGLP